MHVESPEQDIISCSDDTNNWCDLLPLEECQVNAGIAGKVILACRTCATIELPCSGKHLETERKAVPHFPHVMAECGKDQSSIRLMLAVGGCAADTMGKMEPGKGESKGRSRGGGPLFGCAGAPAQPFCQHPAPICHGSPLAWSLAGAAAGG